LEKEAYREKGQWKRQKNLSRIPLLIPLIAFDRQHPLFSTLKVETKGGKKNHFK
jgi:hypothetical protein